MVTVLFALAVYLQECSQERVGYQQSYHYKIDYCQFAEKVMEIFLLNDSGMYHEIRRNTGNQQQYVAKNLPPLPFGKSIKKSCHVIGHGNFCANISDLLEICKILLHVGSWSDQDLLEFLLTCTCWDRMSADDVLLKTFESVDAAADSCLAEHLGSLLE